MEAFPRLHSPIQEMAEKSGGVTDASASSIQARVKRKDKNTTSIYFVYAVCMLSIQTRSVYCPSTLDLTKLSSSPAFLASSKSGRGISKKLVFLPYVIPPSRLIGLSTVGSSKVFSLLIASSLAQNLVPSMIARTPVFLPGVARLSNSFVSISLPSMEKIASLTREALTVVHGAGCNPEIDHSDTP